MTLDELIRQVQERSPGGTPLDQLSDASALAAHLGDLADHLVGHFVDQARRSGSSWAQVGGSIGVTRQAAQQRFVVGDTSMESFTNRAAVVVLKAQNAARERGHETLTSEHLLLGFLAEWDGFAGLAIEAAGVSQEDLAQAVERALPPNAEPRLAHASFSPGLKKVLALSVREALRLGHGYVGTEHLLLGLLESADEPAAGLLSGLGVTKDGVEPWTLQALATWKGSRA
ncbi:MAG: Clp protease N-terminal domain-containing protein [Nocardioides sp.]